MTPSIRQEPALQPLDEYNQVLMAHVHPPDWINPKPAAVYDLVVLGAGTAGLKIGLKIALIEKSLLGGDCLNIGCVPSKCVIRSSRVVGEMQNAASFGIHPTEHIDIDFAAVMQRMRQIRAGIGDHDSVDRFSKLGIDVFLGRAAFVDGNTIAVNDSQLRFRKAVIATGARATRPEIPGLAETGYLTNETIFSLTECPKRLAVIGGGPIGCEMAQAFHRLGSDVTILHKNGQLLDREDADAAAVVQQKLVQEKLHLILDCSLEKV